MPALTESPRLALLFLSWLPKREFRYAHGVKRWARIVASLFAIPVVAAALSATTPYPVQVWKQSDDRLTNKLRDSIEAAVKHSKRLSLTSANEPGTLYLIVSPALWEEVGQHTRVTYFVDFGRSANDPKPITRAQGTCWDYQMGQCAAEIVATAEAVAPEAK
ncbi:MAG: hypothetical protein JOY77_09140 [Alphaproteobacteria bacterium]|nr:hypothetical protein [Alphaproteobacteria bacterium]MBV9063075.1 hypothetical protein [Alphaproteobacteria bacterium]